MLEFAAYVIILIGLLISYNISRNPRWWRPEAWRQPWYKKQDIIRPFTPAAYDVAQKLRPADIEESTFSVRTNKILSSLGIGLFMLCLGVFLIRVFVVARYLSLMNAISLLLGIYAAAHGASTSLQALLSWGDELRVRRGVAHLYRWNRRQWSLPLDRIERVEVAQIAVTSFVIVFYAVHLEVYTGLGEDHRIWSYERFSDAEKMRLLLAGGGGQYGAVGGGGWGGLQLD